MKVDPDVELNAADKDAGEHWTARHSKPVIFLILTCVAVGIYLAFTIPIAVFPSTDFPRIIVGVDNGVAPIDQMLVTVTRPIEEAINAVPGLDRVRSITSRGTVEVNLFFDWNVDMFQTLNLVNAAVAEMPGENFRAHPPRCLTPKSSARSTASLPTAPTMRVRRLPPERLF